MGRTNLKKGTRLTRMNIYSTMQQQMYAKRQSKKRIKWWNSDIQTKVKKVGDMENICRLVMKKINRMKEGLRVQGK